MLNHQVYLCIPSPSAGSMDGSFGLLLGHRGEIGDGLARLGRLWPGLLDHESVGGSAGEATAPRSLPGRCRGKRAVESRVEAQGDGTKFVADVWSILVTTLRVDGVPGSSLLQLLQMSTFFYFFLSRRTQKNLAPH